KVAMEDIYAYIDPATEGEAGFPGRLPSSESERRNLLLVLDQLKSQGKDPLRSPIVVDIGGSKPHYNEGYSPCLTHCRAGSGGHWLTWKQRKMTTCELLKIMDVPPADVKWSSVSPRQLGLMAGNAIPVKMLSMVLSQALKCANLQAPPKKEFEEFATKRQAAGSLRSMKAVGGRWKLARLQNCLGGACQRIDAAFLLSSTCIVLHQDVRRLVLMVRFRACNDKLEVKRGLLGIHHLQDSMTESLVQGTRAILSQFVEGDEDQMAALQQKVILLNMDAAADEQLAGRLMACNDGLFPGVKQVCRDRAHAARRVISRPFKASAEIWDVFQALIWGNASMPATIQSSDVLRKVFNQYVKDMGGDRVQSMSLCKQRFDSHQKATGRLILWLRPTIKTAIYATVYRHNLRDGERGALFLRSLSEERVLLLAMVADFTDEATSIIRLMDSEAGDVATHNIELDVFASRVKHLFIDEHAFDVDGKSKTLGGPNKVSPAMIARCFASMKKLVGLSTEVIASEFPAYEILTALKIFDVSEVARTNREESVDYIQSLHTSSERLCQLFEASADSFIDEYWDHKAIAFHHHSTNPNCSSFESWKYAVQKTSSRKSTAARHPSSNLHWILIHFGALDGCTTSGVEQHFSKMVRIVSAERSLLTEENKNLELKFMFDFAPATSTDCIEMAQQLWIEWYGEPRKGSTSRLDLGTKRGHKKGSEADFLAKRRRLDGPVKLLPHDEVRLEASANLPADCQRVQAELTFQRNKQFKNTIQSYLSGHLTAKEVPDGMVDVAQAFVELETRRDATRVRGVSKFQALLAPSPPQFDRRNHWIFLEMAEWSQNPEFFRCKVTQDLQLPLFFVVANPEKPPSQVLWAASVRGGCVLDLACMRGIIENRHDKATTGIAFLYDAAYAIKRQIFLCPSFRAANTEASEIIQAAAGQERSKWKMIDGGWEAFAEASAKSQQAGRKWAVLGLTIPQIAANMQEDNLMSSKTFLKFVSRVHCCNRGF
ncbi:unnamed protein product, partial [Cladocopium goreaui]